MPQYQVLLEELHRMYDSRLEDILPHSTAYFNEFYAQLIDVLGPPRILIERLINYEKTLSENLTVLSELLEKQTFHSLTEETSEAVVANAGGEKSRLDAQIAACAEVFVRLTTAGTFDTFDTDTIPAVVWQSVASRTVGQLKRSMYQIKLGRKERLKHLTSLLGLLACLIKLQSQYAHDRRGAITHACKQRRISLLSFLSQSPLFLLLSLPAPSFTSLGCCATGVTTIWCRCRPSTSVASCCRVCGPRQLSISPCSTSFWRTLKAPMKTP